VTVIVNREKGGVENGRVGVSVGSVAVRVAGLGVLLGDRVSVAVGIRVMVPVLVGVHRVLSNTAVSVSAERVGNLIITTGVGRVEKLQPANPNKTASTRHKLKMENDFAFIKLLYSLLLKNGTKGTAV
jgi:hypothetical protein